MAIKGTAVAAVGVAGVLLYAGIQGKSIGSVTRILLSGQSPATATPANQIAATSSGTTGGVTTTGGIPSPVAHGGTAALNQAKAKIMAVAYGWSTGQQWAALVALWNRESSWNQYAANPSGAYGIPQALPGSKMGRLANPPFSLAVAQIRWGLSYIKQRYGNPVNAWAHEEANGWY